MAREVLESLAIALASADPHVGRGASPTQWGDMREDEPGSRYRTAWRERAKELKDLLRKVGLSIVGAASAPSTQADLIELAVAAERFVHQLEIGGTEIMAEKRRLLACIAKVRDAGLMPEESDHG